MDFDRKIAEKFGILLGDPRVILIKTGRGGSVYGQDCKYLHIARKLRSKFGCTIVVAANPADEECNLAEELQQIRQAVACDEIHMIGISNGALVGAQQGYRETIIRTMLLINGPLMINWPRTQEGLERFTGEHVRMIYGELDPSYRYLGLLDLLKQPRLDYRSLEGVDHRFTDAEDLLRTCIRDYYEEWLGVKG